MAKYNPIEHTIKYPLSERTEKQKRNALLMCLVCLFIGITGKLPESFNLLGLTFDDTDKNTMG